MSQIPHPGLNEPIVGSTLLPNHSMTPVAYSNEVNTLALTLNNITATDITHNPSASSPKELMSALAISKKFETISDLFDKAENLLNRFSNPYVISDPLVDPHFLDLHWGSENVSFDHGLATISRKTDIVPYAYLRIDSSAFTTPGIYYVELEITTLTPTSKIEVKIETDALLKEITLPGIYKFKYTVERPSTALLYFYVTELPTNGEIVFDHVYLHSVKPSMHRYMTYIQETADGDESGYVTLTQVLDATANTLSQAKAYTNGVLSNIETLLETHTDDFNNPHHTTAIQCGAAPEVHTHTPVQCGAAPLQHTHDGSDISLGGADLSQMTAHMADTNNVYHQVTKTQVGLSNIPNAISDLTTLDSDSTLATSKAVYTNNLNLQTHIANLNNPHNTDKADIGLNDIENFPIATLEEHVSGKANCYASAEGMFHAFQAWSAAPVDVLKMQPIITHQFQVTSGQSRTIPLLQNKIYRIHLRSTEKGLNTLKLKYGLLDHSQITDYRNSFVFSTPGIAPYINSSTSEDNHIQILPTITDVNFGTSTITLNTDTFEFTSITSGRILNASDEFYNTALIQYQSSTSISAADLQEYNELLIDINSLTFESDTSIWISVYELTPVHSHPSVIVDATPVGHLSSALKLNPQQRGWSYIDGSNLNRTDYHELWAYAQIVDKVISQNDWDLMNTNGDDIPFFGTGDDVTTFTLPKIQNLNDPWVLNIIKVRNVSLPKDTQVLFQLITGS